MWSDWLVFCDFGFSLSALWCPLLAPPVLLGFPLPWTWGFSLWLLQQVQPLLLTLDMGYFFSAGAAKSTGDGNDKPLQFSCLENPMNSMKRQKDRTLKDKLPRAVGAQYATGDQWRNNSRKNEGVEPKQKQHPVVDVTSDRSKVRCCKEQYWVGTWNVRSMNQGMEEVKQEMARVNIDILRISELKWTGMGEFKSDEHYIYYCGQEPLRRNGVAIIVNKSQECSTWMQSPKWQNDLCLFPRQTIQYHINPSMP